MCNVCEDRLQNTSDRLAALFFTTSQVQYQPLLAEIKRFESSVAVASPESELTACLMVVSRANILRVTSRAAHALTLLHATANQYHFDLKSNAVDYSRDEVKAAREFIGMRLAGTVAACDKTLGTCGHAMQWCAFFDLMGC